MSLEDLDVVVASALTGDEDEQNQLIAFFQISRNATNTDEPIQAIQEAYAHACYWAAVAWNMRKENPFADKYMEACVKALNSALIMNMSVSKRERNFV